MSKLKEKPQINQEVKLPDMSGLDQSFVNRLGQQMILKNFLTEKDWYELKSKKRVVHILTHDAVKKIAKEAGITTTPEYSILVQPSTTNNYTFLIQVRITDHMGRQTIDLGESSRSNLGTKGRSNPANMAQKRAFDRAVFTHLGITGLLGEDELPDEEDPTEMDKLTPEESQAIAPLINKLFATTNKQLLSAFNSVMKKEKDKYTENQVNVLRGLYKKKLAEMQNSF